ncbi:hypothetical protein LLS47_24490, partial [Rouxiella badensis]|uniref:hypothetical protein n=1 Tax=Rouxiella badensis TaxID=1646377 RepID=UPI001D15B361
PSVTGGRLSYQYWLNGYIRHWVYAYEQIVFALKQVELDMAVREFCHKLWQVTFLTWVIHAFFHWLAKY